jgi:hypothetical protein
LNPFDHDDDAWIYFTINNTKTKPSSLGYPSRGLIITFPVKVFVNVAGRPFSVE